MYRPTSKNEWWLCGTLFTQAVLVIALESYILVEWQLWVTPTITQVPVSYVIPIGLSILTFACVYEFLLALDAIHHRNNILLFAICISNVCSLVYAAMHCDYIRETTAGLFAERYMFPTLVDTTYNVWPRIQPAEILVPIITGLGNLSLWPCVYCLHRDYSWAIYKCVHGSSETRMRYLAYEVFLVLNKLNFYFIVGFIIQYNLVDVHFEEPEYTLTMTLIPVAFIVMVLGIYFVRHERMFCMVPINICYLGLVAYFISRIIVLNGHTLRAHVLGKGMMLLFAYIALVFSFTMFVCSIVCVANFNHGLKKVNKGRNNAARESYMLNRRSNYPTDQVSLSYPSSSPSRKLLD